MGVPCPGLHLRTEVASSALRHLTAALRLLSYGWVDMANFQFCNSASVCSCMLLPARRCCPKRRGGALRGDGAALYPMVLTAPQLPLAQLPPLYEPGTPPRELEMPPREPERLGGREPVMEGLADPQLPLVQGVLLMQALPVQPPGVYVTVVPQFPLHDDDWPAHCE